MSSASSRQLLTVLLGPLRAALQDARQLLALEPASAEAQEPVEERGQQPEKPSGPLPGRSGLIRAVRAAPPGPVRRDRPPAAHLPSPIEKQRAGRKPEAAGRQPIDVDPGDATRPRVRLEGAEIASGRPGSAGVPGVPPEAPPAGAVEAAPVRSPEVEGDSPGLAAPASRAVVPKAGAAAAPAKVGPNPARQTPERALPLEADHLLAPAPGVEEGRAPPPGHRPARPTRADLDGAPAGPSLDAPRIPAPARPAAASKVLSASRPETSSATPPAGADLPSLVPSMPPRLSPAARAPGARPPSSTRAFIPLGLRRAAPSARWAEAPPRLAPVEQAWPAPEPEPRGAPLASSSSISSPAPAAPRPAAIPALSPRPLQVEQAQSAPPPPAAPAAGTGLEERRLEQMMADILRDAARDEGVEV